MASKPKPATQAGVRRKSYERRAAAISRRPSNAKIVDALLANAGDVRRSAAALNVSRSTLHRWIAADLERCARP